MELLKEAIAEAEKKKKMNLIETPGVKKIFKIVYDFIKAKKLICYGGTAINNILPANEQFYKSYDIPDYDFFSTTPMEDAKELADIYFKNGYQNIEAKSGVHHGTYKVFVDFIPVADITYAEQRLFDNLKKDAIKNGLLYAPPNFLRMAMYSELSRPDGDVSRWEKVYTRLLLLNKYYPIPRCKLAKNNDTIFKPLLKIFIANKVVFFGGYAFSIHTNKNSPISCFDVITTEPKKVATQVMKEIKAELVVHDEIGDYIGKRYEIKVDGVTVANIYEPIACYNYNTITFNGHKINVATIETMLSFYLLFLYIGDYDTDKIICMCHYLMKTKVTGFSLKCIGEQKTLRDIFMEKDKMKRNKRSKKYKEAFFRYIPKKKTRKYKPNFFGF